MKLARVHHNHTPTWGMVNGDQIDLLSVEAAHLSEVLRLMGSELPRSGASIAINAAQFLSPVTRPCKVICQGKNYADHRVETGSDPDKPDFNLIFSKSESAITGPTSKVPIPEGVQLLDYEIELGLVIGKTIDPDATITEDNWTGYIAGLVVANDLSARDVQITQGQWFKGKSFHNFCPVGPYVQVLDKTVVEQFFDLELTLSVNDEVRQQASTSALLYKPCETLQELKDVITLHPGDLLLTGTPGGVALSAPSAFKQKIATLLFSERKRMELFVKSQLSSDRYLKKGDQITASIRSGDASIDLGTQNLVVT